MPDASPSCKMGSSSTLPLRPAAPGDLAWLSPHFQCASCTPYELMLLYVHSWLACLKHALQHFNQALDSGACLWKQSDGCLPVPACCAEGLLDSAEDAFVSISACI